MPQLFYKYTMIFREVNLIDTDIIDVTRQIDILTKIQKYFNTVENIIHIVSYKPGSDKSFTIEWSVCNLPNKCQTEGLTVTANSIFTTQSYTEVKAEFASIFQSRYQLLNALITSADVTKLQYTKPTANVALIEESLNFCGGFRYQFAANVFSDEQQGNTRNLELFVEDSTGKNDLLWL